MNGRFRHGATCGRRKTPEYESWRGMHQRCRNPNQPSWKYYGGKGIRVCERWSGPDGFSNFLADMGSRPPGTSLDRVDSAAHYEPGNCRWSSVITQAREGTAALKRYRALRAERRMRERCAKSWQRYRTLYFSLDMDRICLEVRGELEGQFGPPRGVVLAAHDVAVESYFWDEDFDVNFHTNDASEEHRASKLRHRSRVRPTMLEAA